MNELKSMAPGIVRNAAVDERQPDGAAFGIFYHAAFEPLTIEFPQRDHGAAGHVAGRPVNRHLGQGGLELCLFKPLSPRRFNFFCYQ